MKNLFYFLFQNKKQILIILSLLIIFAISVFFRLWQLDLIPPGFYPDEAMNANDGLTTLNTKEFKLFYPENNGREGLFMWILALSFYIFGVSIWSFRFVPAIFGILTVLGTYLLTKEIFNNQEKYKRYSQCLGLLAAFFIAVSFWHINFSRIGFRAIMAPFFLGFGFYFLLYALRKKKYFFSAISGVFLGLGFYSYISYRFTVFIIIYLLSSIIFTNLKNKELVKKYIRISLLNLLVIFIVALPIGIYFLQNPHDFLGRATGVSVFERENPIFETGKSIILHLGMFNIAGDWNWRHNFSGNPQFLLPVGIFFILGIAILTLQGIKTIKEKNYPSSVILFLPMVWFLSMMMPGFLSAEGIPHALRVIPIMPAVFIFPAFGFFWVYEKIKTKITAKNSLLFLNATILIFLFSIAYVEFDRYFFKWGEHPETKNAFTRNYFEIGKYLNFLPDNIQKYVIVNEFEYPLYGISIPAQTLIFIESTKYNNIRTNYITAQELDSIILKEKTIIIPLYKGEVLKQINKKFPQAEVIQKQRFIVYQITNE